MRDEAALLQAIIDSPADDVPRLVYADWLEEHAGGERAEEARAELIRVQCRLDADSPADPAYPDLLEREEEVRVCARRALERERAALPGNGPAWDAPVRGFSSLFTDLGHLRSNPQPLLDALAAACRVPVGGFRGMGCEEELAALLLRQPFVASFARLHLHSHTRPMYVDTLAREVAGCPHARNVTDLRLPHHPSDLGLEAVARSPFLGALRALDVWVDNVSEGGWRPVADSPLRRQLRALTLRGLEGAGLLPLPDLPSFPRVHTLELGGSLLPTALAALARSDVFPALACLRLSPFTRLGLGGLEALVKAAGWTLTHLALPACHLGDEDLRALAKSPLADSLRVLDLSLLKAGPAGLQALVHSPGLANLRHLSLEETTLTEGTLQALAASTSLRRLTRLNLAESPGRRQAVPAKAVLSFLRDLPLPNLRHLRLDGLKVGDRGARLLAAAPRFANLTVLSLHRCGIGDSGAAALVSSAVLRQLVDLDLSANSISTGLEGLADRTNLPRLARCAAYAGKMSPAARAAFVARGGAPLS